MRVAIISDIHGNCFALDAALADLRQRSVEQIVCLGDTLQGGAQPAETAERLRSLGCPVVMGNADAWLLTNDENDSVEPTTEQQREVRAWTLSKLSAADLAFLRTFQPTIEITLEGEQRLLCFHGSPHSYDDIILPDAPEEEVQRLLGAFSPAIMTGGHTHTQQTRRVGDGLFFNPGSIGLAYNYRLPADQFRADPWAEYAILTYEQGRLSLEFRRVPYDVEELLRIVQASGRPHAERAIADYRSRKQE